MYYMYTVCLYFRSSHCCSTPGCRNKIQHDTFSVFMTLCVFVVAVQYISWVHIAEQLYMCIISWMGAVPKMISLFSNYCPFICCLISKHLDNWSYGQISSDMGADEHVRGSCTAGYMSEPHYWEANWPFPAAYQCLVCLPVKYLAPPHLSITVWIFWY